MMLKRGAAYEKAKERPKTIALKKMKTLSASSPLTHRSSSESLKNSETEDPQPLQADFFSRPVVQVAQDLIGCVISHGETSGIIVETEAYHQSEQACHGYCGPRPRTRSLFGPAGRAYIYRSYGIHTMINLVCENEGVGAGVLIRAIEPLRGHNLMLSRRGLSRESHHKEIASGPGKLTQALGITLHQDGSDISRGPIVVSSRHKNWLTPKILAGPRIGISRALELKWRFCAGDSIHVSKPWLKE